MYEILVNMQCNK